MVELVSSAENKELGSGIGLPAPTPRGRAWNRDDILLGPVRGFGKLREQSWRSNRGCEDQKHTVRDKREAPVRKPVNIVEEQATRLQRAQEPTAGMDLHLPLPCGSRSPTRTAHAPQLTSQAPSSFGHLRSGGKVSSQKDATLWVPG